MRSLQPQWLPYCGAAPEPTEWLGRWNLDPVLLAGLVFVAVLGIIQLRGGNRTAMRAFVAGMAVLAVLFVSPLCALTSALFSARAVHHALLVAVTAPLLVWALLPGRQRIFASATTWTIVQAAVIWAWHWPALYAAALAHGGLYWLMQLTLLGTALGFWSAVRQAPITTAVAALLATMVQMGLLGAILTFAGTALYAPHFGTTGAWGFSPLEDQQLAGLIMWAPAAALYLLAALLLAARWLRADASPATR